MPLPALLFLLIGAATSLSCAADDSAAITAFAKQYAVTAEAAEKAVAASYPYQLSDLPEAQTISRVMAKIGARAATPADLQEALKAEEGRAWFVDHFSVEVEALRSHLAQLTLHGDAVADGEIRVAAQNVCERFDTLLGLTEGLLSAQRERSRHLRQFLTSLANRERRFPSLAEMEGTNSELVRLRDRLTESVAEHEAAFEAFQTTSERTLAREPRIGP
jgi:hypothetical protein